LTIFDFHEPPASKLDFDVKVELGSIDCNFDLEVNLGLNLNYLNELAQIINLN